ncbi:MAG: ADP-ribosylglycohydrolase family protein [Methanomicrobium sp.]|nr:ADP-ribosylglycohydrolase family protein [Methanomicrobium sp.]
MIFIFDYLRGAGTIIGLATGDAMGAPLEGLNPQKEPVREMISGGLHHVRAGDITDDTLSALAITDSLIENKGFFPDDIAFRMCNEYIKKPDFFGPTSALVFNDMLKGKDPFAVSKELYERGGGRSNGSVMRGAPIGVFYPPEKTRNFSITCSRITHYHPVACECTAFVNNLVSRLCRGESKNNAYDNAFLECENRDVKRVLGNLKSYPLNPSLDSLEATHCAVSIFMDADNFEEMLIRAVNLGGDADTIGAISGAVGGAFWGCNEIPQRWVRKLNCLKRIETAAFSLAENAL